MTCLFRTQVEERMTKRLPIADHKERLVKAVLDNDCVVVTGETGCGKTTQLPQFLHDAGLSKQGIIGVTQPRRVAAISVASRVSEEMGVRLGETVGYQVRFDDCTSPERTRVKYMTDGCLLRELLDDRVLSRYSVIVLDEAHERSLATDILFGLVKRLQQQAECERRATRLKVVIMSATLDTDKFSQFFNRCPVFEIPGRLYPVDVVYCFKDGEFDDGKLTYMSHVCRVVMEIHLEEDEGDILVFLTGQQEIESVCDRLFKMAEDIDYDHDVRCGRVQGMLILPLYGSMPVDQQKRVFEPCDPAVRRVIVSTNIAATSVTVDGVVYVVDSGYVKQSSHNQQTGLDSLQVVPIAQSEAKQRAGRAGRTAPGQCYRLYSAAFFSAQAEDTVPEIQRVSLTSVMLSLKSMGISNVVEFAYLDPPEERMILEAVKQLYYFQCIDQSGQITSLGRQVVEYPLQPSLARVLIRSQELDCIDVAAPIVAMLSVEGVFVRPAGKKQGELANEAHKEIMAAAGGSSDFATLLAVYQMCVTAKSPWEWCKEHFVHWRTLKSARSIVEQLKNTAARQNIYVKEKEVADRSLSERVRCCLCYGLFNNVARRTPGRKHFRTMDGYCTTAGIHPGSALFGKEEQLDWVVYHELVDTARPYMRMVCPIRYAWVQDLLPLLHEVDAYQLSSCARRSVATEGEEPSLKKRRSLGDGERACVQGRAEREVEVNEKMSAARARYLKRKGRSS